MNIKITLADLASPAFADLVHAHKQLMLEHSPPESSHALLIDGLRAPTITVWSMFDGEALIGCGALKILTADHGEIKAMHTVAARRGEGLGRRMLTHIIATAKERGVRRLSLETGIQEGFSAARRLYESHGFARCGPFSDYRDDPNSVFMALDLPR